MDENTNRYLDLMQKKVDEEQLQRVNIQNQYAQQSNFQNGGDKTLAEIQLDLEKLLSKLFHLLSGHKLGMDQNNNEGWLEPKDDRQKIFSEYGVNRIMNILSFYLDVNTLLSNYDKETIQWKVRDFGIELSDLIYTQYELFFSYPSPEVLFENYLPGAKATASENNLEVDEVELYNKCLQWSKEELQLKVRNYPMIVMALVDTVHSTYLRALNGEERTSLRKQMHISQSSNINAQQQGPKASILNPSTWGAK